MARPPRKSASGIVRIGISGWTYAPWRGSFYPRKLAQKNELAYASSIHSSIEINGTFYGLQRPSSFAAWHSQTPVDFVFSVKAPRFITHIRRLRDVKTPMANFLLSGVLRLNEKLGPILWQLPPNLQFDEQLLETFFSQLPHSTKDAAVLLRNADSRIKGRSWVEIDRDRPMRHAIEVRHESFASEKFAKLARKHGVAIVVADSAGKWPMLEQVTADFVYVRMHGDEELYASGYSASALNAWAKKIRGWAERSDSPKRDVYVYFDNDVKVRSPFDAATLAVKLGLREHVLEEIANKKIKESPRRHWPGLAPKSRGKQLA